MSDSCSFEPSASPFLLFPYSINKAGCLLMMYLSCWLGIKRQLSPAHPPYPQLNKSSKNAFYRVQQSESDFPKISLTIKRLEENPDTGKLKFHR